MEFGFNENDVEAFVVLVFGGGSSEFSRQNNMCVQEDAAPACDQLRGSMSTLRNKYVPLMQWNSYSAQINADEQLWAHAVAC